MSVVCKICRNEYEDDRIFAGHLVSEHKYKQVAASDATGVSRHRLRRFFKSGLSLEDAKKCHRPSTMTTSVETVTMDYAVEHAKKKKDKSHLVVATKVNKESIFF